MVADSVKCEYVNIVTLNEKCLFSVVFSPK